MTNQTSLTFGAPAIRDSETSVAAADRILPHLPRLERIVLDAILSAGPAGMTDAEVEAATGLAGNTVRPRRVYLQAHHYVYRTKHERPTPSGRCARVYVANIHMTTEGAV